MKFIILFALLAQTMAQETTAPATTVAQLDVETTVPAPAETTQAASSAAPVETTQSATSPAPVETTAAPEATTQAVVNTTIAEVNTTVAEVNTTVAATTEEATTTTTTTTTTTAAPELDRFECFKCSGPSESCQNERIMEQCPPTDAPLDLTGYYRCMLATNRIDNTVFQGCVSSCKADSNDFYERKCTTVSRANCISGLQCTQSGPEAPIAGARGITYQMAVVEMVVCLSYIAHVFRN